MINQVIKRLGGRHLIFRARADKSGILPRPYALVSTFRGPVWFFFGAGQVWLSHKKYHEYDGWLARVPRVLDAGLPTLLDRLETPITQFTHFCNEHGFEGTIVIEQQRIEFHWTFGYPLEKEKQKTENTNLLEAPFQKLADEFMRSQFPKN